MPVVNGVYRAPNAEESAAIEATAATHAKVDTSEWTKDEKSLLLYAETRSVDHAGRICGAQMNGEDLAVARGFVKGNIFEKFGRIPFHIIEGFRDNRFPDTHYVVLSEEGWKKAHELRRQRFSLDDRIKEHLLERV